MTPLDWYIVGTAAILIGIGVLILRPLARRLDRLAAAKVDREVDAALTDPRYAPAREPDRYFLVVGNGPTTEVSKADYVRAERAAGFRNSMGLRDEPATASFTGTVGGEMVSGLISYMLPKPWPPMPGVDPEPTSLYIRGWNDDDVLHLARLAGVERRAEP